MSDFEAVRARREAALKASASQPRRRRCDTCLWRYAAFRAGDWPVCPVCAADVFGDTAQAVSSGVLRPV